MTRSTETENIKILAQDLEKQELDAPTGVLNPEVYAQLLAIYLYQNDLCNAKYLWKRIPPAAKLSHNELALIWQVGQKMWQRDYPGVYAALAVEWSPNVAEIMAALHGNVSKRAVHLVSHAYCSISYDALAVFVGQPSDAAVSQAAGQGWQVDPALRMVNPCKPAPEPSHVTSSEEQLNKLTEFVSFLEN